MTERGGCCDIYLYLQCLMFAMVVAITGWYQLEIKIFLTVLIMWFHVTFVQVVSPF